jgi:FKBP-type peptidyl-prolyl cis-trans isomerase SlyD
VQTGWHSVQIKVVKMSNKKLYTVNYWLKNPLGEVVDTSEGGQPMMFVEGSHRIIPGIQKAVSGRSVGDMIEVSIPPALAYGEHSPDLVAQMPVSAFDGVEDIRVGMKFQTNTGGQAKVVKVIDVKGDQVTVDANHPLAGLTLMFDLEILDVREAEASDLEAY